MRSADTLTEATNVNEEWHPYAAKPVIEAIVKSGGVPVIFSVSPELVPDYLDLLTGSFAGADVDQHFWRNLIKSKG